jgi:hypothetical protein
LRCAPVAKGVIRALQLRCAQCVANLGSSHQRRRAAARRGGTCGATRETGCRWDVGLRLQTPVRVACSQSVQHAGAVVLRLRRPAAECMIPAFPVEGRAATSNPAIQRQYRKCHCCYEPPKIPFCRRPIVKLTVKSVAHGKTKFARAFCGRWQNDN